MYIYGYIRMFVCSLVSQGSLVAIEKSRMRKEKILYLVFGVRSTKKHQAYLTQCVTIPHFLLLDKHN